MGNKVTTLDKVAINDLIDLGLRMPDGSTELFDVVEKRDGYVVLMSKNIIDFMPFNFKSNKHSGNANSYVKSSVRTYLAGLYQAVVEENKLLEAYTVGNKEFFLPSLNALGLGGQNRWEAFNGDASRVKYPGTFAATREGANGPGEADWYWTCSQYERDSSYLRVISSEGHTGKDYAHYEGIGVAPAVILKASTPVILIDGVWHLHDVDAPSEDTKPKAVKPYSLIKAVNAERVASDHYHEGNNGNDVWQFASDNFSGDRVKGFHQVNAIKYIARYHKKHQSKEKQLEDLRKAIGEIKELIRLEGGEV